VGEDGRAEAADGVGQDCFGGELAVAKGVEHGGVGAEESAPTHANGGEYGYGVAVDPAVGHEVGDEAEGGADGAEGCDGEGNEVVVVESEEPFEDDVDFVGEPG
jgi:hypothetical protein